MKLETFFEKFELLAEAPGAVAKMRELVLNLAVLGKLVDQDPNDEPAARLFHRLVEFKLANPLSGRSGRSKESPVEPKSKVDDLPLNWVNASIGAVLSVIRGASPRPKGDPQYFSATRTPYHWVKISDIRKHGLDGKLMDTDEFLTEAGMRKSVLLPKGTLVLTNSATIGIPIVLGVEGCCIHDGYLAFPNFPHELLSQKFLQYLFHTLKKHAEANARGLAQLNLNTDLVRSFQFGLPPLAEQKRIVAKVDELMELCDRLEAQQQEREARHATLTRASLARFAEAPTPANLEFLFHKSYDIAPADLRKSILTLAFQGKLVRQGPNDEPAECLVQRLARECIPEQRPRSAGLNLSPFAEDALPYELPGSWAWARFSDVAIIASNLVKPDAFLDFAHLAPDNVEKGTGVLLPCATVREDKVISSNHRFFPGQIIYSKIRPNLAKVVLVDFEGLCSADMYPIDPLIDARYLQRYMLSDTFLVQAVKADTRVAMPKINQTELNAVAVPVPPLAEQRRIVARVEELMALVDKLEAQLGASRAIAASYLESVVHELSTARRES